MGGLNFVHCNNGYNFFSVMNVSFASRKFVTTEGDGYVEVVLLKTAGAVGPVSVQLSTLDGTATGQCLCGHFIYTLFLLICLSHCGSTFL